MMKTDKVFHRVQGLAVALPEAVIKSLDGNYGDLNFKREELYVKPTDLSPFYKPPFKAYAYVMVINSETPLGLASDNRTKAVAKTIYWHNKLQAVDTDIEVSLEIEVRHYSVVNKSLWATSVVPLHPVEVDGFEFPKRSGNPQ